MINYVLGAPGSGKSLIIPRLRELLPDRVVLDWDAFMGPAGELAGAPIPETPQTWQPYGRLVRAVADAASYRGLGLPIVDTTRLSRTMLPVL
ncbi:hypothetical protein [Microlunatus sp. Gsoil 973]|uniref:hypothetical protein n=1 Tax=Microlunatus sp. Gsoil 973 TaxID=2672569 RepID=UPI0012B4AD45|nr:hypothetical protein [Microlunatus sp. Gsoil 973]QGN32633.1 hypothetical protein GJV80_07235 [Microlunatus sp. Gsoil 973]